MEAYPDQKVTLRAAQPCTLNASYEIKFVCSKITSRITYDLVWVSQDSRCTILLYISTMRDLMVVLSPPRNAGRYSPPLPTQHRAHRLALRTGEAS